MKKNKHVVVVPIHSSTPSADEKMSFAQCFDILLKHDIVVVHPKGINLKEYQDINNNFIGLPIDPVWQSSLENYNKLKCSLFFYNLFADYDYLLTYELDSFVFRDELDMWCDKGYSYIGAPWFKGYAQALPPYEIIGVGNSGFSLRHINTCIKILKRLRSLKPIYKIYHKLKLINFVSFFNYGFFNRFFRLNKTDHLFHIAFDYYFNEDTFWASIIKDTFTDFKVAPYNEALQFSFEVNPAFLFEENSNKLPFGCHAWQKYDPAFWEPFINRYDVKSFTKSRG